MQKNVWCVEDDASILEMVIYALKAGGFNAVGFRNAVSFKEKLKVEAPDMLLLDIMLPDGDGLELLREMKSRAPLCGIPVIILTAKTCELDKVKGLDSGADDYMTKPFGKLELISRVKAVLRRSGNSAEKQLPRVMSVNGITLDPYGRVVTRDGRQIGLTMKEFDLLAYLIANRGKALTREEIMNDVWSFDYEGESRTVDMHIKSLRRKLKDDGETIVTVRGIGYKIP